MDLNRYSDLYTGIAHLEMYAEELKDEEPTTGHWVLLHMAQLRAYLTAAEIKR